MTNPNFATDILTATAGNYKAVSLTKSAAAALVKPPVVSQPKPELEKPVNDIEMIDLSLISVDRTYQRCQKPYVKKMARDEFFDQNAVGNPVINRRPDNSLWAIDGQQRIAMLKMRGITHWPCRIVNLKTVPEEADLFGVLNGSENTAAAVSQGDRFKALIAAQDKHALACVAAVEKGGMRLVDRRHPYTNRSDEVWNQIDSSTFIMMWATTYGYDQVTRACRIISESWPMSPDARRWTVVGAVFRLVGNFPNLDDARAIKQFRLMPAITVDQEAKKEARTSSIKASGAVPFLLKIYNKGKRNRLGEAKPEQMEGAD